MIYFPALAICSSQFHYVHNSFLTPYPPNLVDGPADENDQSYHCGRVDHQEKNHHPTESHGIHLLHSFWKFVLPFHFPLIVVKIDYIDIVFILNFRIRI